MGPEHHMAPPPARRIWRGYVEDAHRLDSSAVVRAVRQQHPELWRRWAATGEAVVAPVVSPLTRGGRHAGETALVVGLDGTRGAVGLTGGAWAPLSAKLSTPPGATAGFRWSWRCPDLGHRCDALFRPLGQAEFLSRQAHGLQHRSVGESRMARLARQARKLRRRLGEDPPVIGSPWPVRPLRMTPRTYAWLLARRREAEGRVLAASERMVVRMMRRPHGVAERTGRAG